MAQDDNSQELVQVPVKRDTSDVKVGVGPVREDGSSPFDDFENSTRRALGPVQLDSPFLNRLDPKYDQVESQLS